VQAVAEPGTVVVTGETHRLISGLFVVEDRGSHALKGVAREIRLYRVIRPSGMRGRFEAMTAARGLTPFVGREEELRLLTNRWERVCEGEGQVVAIVGEAGMGKSRLLQRFREAIAATPYTWLECATAPFFQNTPFYAVGRSSFDWDTGQSAEQRLTALEGSLASAGLDPKTAVPLIAPFLDLPLGDRYPSLSIAPDQQRKRLLATLVGWAFGAAKVQALVIAIEDLHWVDPSTLELIQLFVEQGATARLLLLYTARPEFRAPWATRAHHTQLTINRLNARHVRTMVSEVAAQKALSDEAVATVVERTGGVPLFVEELTRAVLESGGAKLTGREIPATLHDSLMARLDRLGAAKEVVQVGAVIGSDFSYELLHAVHPMAEIDLQGALRSLTDAELLYVRGIAPEATYQFKHALIRDAAYEALLKSRRKELHLTVARAIDQQFPAVKEMHPEVLARHWTEAGEAELAIAAWQRAGEHAVERRAYPEAERHYSDALAIVKTLSESRERNGRELRLQLTLGGVMQATRGFGSSEASACATHARTLAEEAGEAQSFQIFFGLWNTASSRGELREALALSDQMLEIGGRSRSASHLLIAHFAKGQILHYLGRLTEAREHLPRAVEHYREADFLSEVNDPGVNARIWAGINESYLGYPDSARRYLEDAIALARRLKKPLGLAFAATLGSMDYCRQGYLERARLAAQEAEQLSAELGLPLFQVMARNTSAWIRARMGAADGAADVIQHGIAEYDAQRFYLARAWNLTVLSETQALAGATDTALVTIDQALETNPDELLYRPWALLLRGELRFRSAAGREADLQLAEHDLREAIELARGMSARMDELRATLRLARLMRHTDRRDEARARLAEIYNWFTEGFDTADLKEAKTLLDELGS
jgi:hypothetical protein